jgi:UDP-N-acetyl-D-glucosamine dehydrogenase
VEIHGLEAPAGLPVAGREETGMGMNLDSDPLDRLAERIAGREAVVGVIGLGYVGLPLAVTIARAGYLVIGLDIDPEKPQRIAAGRSYIGAVMSTDLGELVSKGRLSATTEFAALGRCDVVIVCVPTPLTRHRTPDMSYIEATATTIVEHLRPGQLVVLESTTYPGTTREVVLPILESRGLKAGTHFLLGYSPEREDPGNQNFETASIPKVVSGLDARASELVTAFYGSVVRQVVPVPSCEVAEAVKITENIFRAVNIALVNELKMIFDAMGLDIWQVIDAARTKPFGFMPFYPGPGLGGHCIPIDPYYLAWKSREFEVPTRFIELAGEINTQMPLYVVRRLEEALDRSSGTTLGSSKILLIGLAYKKNVADIRESPSLKLVELLEKRGAAVSYHDPHVPAVPVTREHRNLGGRESVPLSSAVIARHDAVLIATDHDAIDYKLVADNSRLILDTRNVLGRLGLTGSHIVKG